MAVSTMELWESTMYLNNHEQYTFFFYSCQSLYDHPLMPTLRFYPYYHPDILYETSYENAMWNQFIWINKTKMYNTTFVVTAQIKYSIKWP